MSNYQHAQTPAVNDFIAEIESGRLKLAAADIPWLAKAMHQATIDMPEFLFMPTSFEGMADDWHKALDWCTPEDKPGCEPGGEYDAATQRFFDYTSNLFGR